MDIGPCGAFYFVTMQNCLMNEKALLHIIPQWMISCKGNGME